MSRLSLRLGLLGGFSTFLFGSSVIALENDSNDGDILKHVDPLIGTAKGGSYEIRSIFDIRF